MKLHNVIIGLGCFLFAVLTNAQVLFGQLLEARVVGQMILSVSIQHPSYSEGLDPLENPSVAFMTDREMILHVEGLRTKYPYGDNYGKGVSCEITLYKNEVDFNRRINSIAQWTQKYIDKNRNQKVCGAILDVLAMGSREYPVKLFYIPAEKNGNFRIGENLLILPE